MGAGFIRRFGYNPGTSVLTEIEGAVIIDNAPTAPIQGVGTGVVCVVGEFVDATYAVTVAADGTVSTKARPVQILSSNDLIAKTGGFDATIGDFGGDLGNGFVAIRNKRFASLVVAPVDNVTPASATNKGIRVFRDLPTNKSLTVPSPITAVAAAQVPAGREFRSGSSQVFLSAPVNFEGSIAVKTGVDAVFTTVASAATQSVTCASGAFTDGTVFVGDIFVAGVLGTSLNPGTYRIQAISSATVLVLETLTAVNFATSAESSQPWRIHKAACADSAGIAGLHVNAASSSGYRIPARPVTATITTNAVLTPATVPTAGSVSFWDVLSGLSAKNSATALTYDANIHAPMLATTAAMRARYALAIDGTMDDAAPARTINIMVSARKDATIRAYLKQHVITASSRALTRRAIIAPAVDVLTIDLATASTGDGVGVNRSDRIDYCWPGATSFIPEAVGLSIAGADGATYTDGYLDETSDVWLAAVESNLNPERNPGQAAEPIPTVLAPLTGFSRNTPKLTIEDYKVLRAQGVVGLRFDRDSGAIFQSGVTTSLNTGEKNISRRRMADFIQDSIAQRLNMYAKMLMTTGLKDAALADVVGFMEELLSRNNPQTQRIAEYSVDDVSGNTPANEALGIYVILGKVRLLPSADVLVFSSEIGESVVVTVTPA